MPTALTPKLCSEAVATIRPAAQAFAASGGALQSSFAAVCPGSCWAVAYFGFCAVTGNTSSRRLPCLWEVPCFLFQLCLPACKAKTVELPEAFSKSPEDLTLFLQPGTSATPPCWTYAFCKFSMLPLCRPPYHPRVTYSDMIVPVWAKSSEQGPEQGL